MPKYKQTKLRDYIHKALKEKSAAHSKTINDYLEELLGLKPARKGKGLTPPRERLKETKEGC